MSHVKLAFLLLFSFPYSFLYSDDLETYEVITVVSAIPVTQDKVVIAIDQIDRRFIDNTLPKNFSSLLRESLAIDVSSNGGMGQLSSMFLRGSNSNHTLVKVNGIKINPGTAGGASIYNLDSELISSIEIGYGSLSALHGSTALGGVVEISTKPQDTDLKSFGLNIGPDDFNKKFFKYNQGALRNGYFGISVSETKTDGFPSLSNSTLDRGYENSTIITNLEINSEIVELKFSSWLAEGSIEYLVFGAPVSQDYENYAYSAELRNDIKDYFSYKINLSSSKDLIQQNDVNFLNQIDITDTTRNYLEILLTDFDFFPKPEKFVFGFNVENEDVDYSSYGTVYRKEILTKSIFSSASANLFNSTLNGSFRNTDHEIYKSNLSWNIEILKKFKRWIVGASNGSSFRSPVSSELYGFGGNLLLQPEINKSREINIKKIQQDSILGFAFFKNDFTNLITFDYQDYVLRNINQSSNKGMEVRYKLSRESWDLLMILRTQDPKDELGKQLLRRSKKSGSLTLSRDIGNYVGSINLSSYGKRIDFGDIELPAYSLVNLTLSKKFTKNTKISLKLENVFDKDYFTAATSNAYYLNQGRSAWLRLHYDLGD